MIRPVDNGRGQPCGFSARELGVGTEAAQPGGREPPPQQVGAENLQHRDKRERGKSEAGRERVQDFRKTQKPTAGGRGGGGTRPGRHEQQWRSETEIGVMRHARQGDHGIGRR